MIQKEIEVLKRLKVKQDTQIDRETDRPREKE